MPSGQHERADPQPPPGRVREWVVPVVVAIFVAGAFVAGTRLAPRPVAPVASQVVRTQCQINTKGVQAAVEQLRVAVNRKRQRKLTPGQFQRRIEQTIPTVAEAVRSQGVTCKTVP